MVRSMTAALALSVALATGAAAATPAPAPMPRYDHIYLIIEENHSFDQVIGRPHAPNFNRLAKQYGLALNFYAETHPSEPNYIAIVGGDTFGIQDDDAYWCKPHAKRTGCGDSDESGYVDHTITARSLADQLTEHGLSWKGYFEDIPAAGSDASRWPSADQPVAGRPYALYAVKHNGFMSFKSVQDDPKRNEKIVGFDALMRDIAAGTLPNFAHIVPNQCNDMHGLRGDNVDEDCEKLHDAKMIARSDRQLGELVAAIMAGPQWRAPGNSAIVVTFDEDDTAHLYWHPQGCCAASNPGGGWIPTVVITNHGPRGLEDKTPYNHYSLLRSAEDAFGIAEHLGHAADDGKGVVAMSPLFAVRKP